MWNQMVITKEDRKTGKTYELDRSLASNPEYQRQFASVFDFQFEFRQVKPFIHNNWKTIGLPFQLSSMDNTLEAGFRDLDFRIPALHRDWLQNILDFFQAGRPETVSMIGFCVGSVVRCEPDSDLISSIHSDEFHRLEDVYIVDSSMKWGIRSSYAEVTFVAAERHLMDAFLADIGGENLVEYMFAICMNHERLDQMPKTLQWVYRAIDWEMPFEVSDQDRKLPSDQEEQFVDSTEPEICKRFGIDPSMRPRFTE
jgi:hypothetical protein